jgi:hypothetical protein
MVDFVTPVKKDGPPSGPTEVISGTTRLLYSSRVMYVGIAGDGKNIVKTVNPDVPNAVTIEDAGVTSGIRWFRLSRAHGDKFKLQAKDAKGVVVTSCELSVIELPQASGPLEFGLGPADPKSPNKIDFHAYAPKDDPDYIMSGPSAAVRGRVAITISTAPDWRRCCRSAHRTQSAASARAEFSIRLLGDGQQGRPHNTAQPDIPRDARASVAPYGANESGSYAPSIPTPPHSTNRVPTSHSSHRDAR